MLHCNPRLQQRHRPSDTNAWRLRFAQNLHRLFKLIGLSLVDGAAEIGVSYQYLRRMVSIGISRTDTRSYDEIQKIVKYFKLPGVEVLWSNDLVDRVLDPETGAEFIKKFRVSLATELKRRMSMVKITPSADELSLLGRALGVSIPPVTVFDGPEAGKISVILKSDEADAFRRLIDGYYRLARAGTESPD